MKHSLCGLGILLFIATYSVGCLAQKKKKNMKTASALPMGTWMHSHEEDQNGNSDWKTYRRPTFDFPPARGRNGFVLQADHKIALLQPSPNDMRDTLWGTWAETNVKGTLSLSFSNKTVSHFEAVKKKAEVWQVKIW